MKNSIGSLAALAAIATPALATPSIPESADFYQVPVSLTDETPVNFDIDGDGTTDFYVYGNFGDALRIEFDTPTLISVSPVNFGDTFFIEDDTSSGSQLVWADETAYYGFSFVTGGQTHAAWVHFDASSSAPLVVSGGWQTFPGGGITVGTPAAVPEPSSYAVLAGAAALIGVVASRRRSASRAA
jgi:hypothetical protein